MSRRILVLTVGLLLVAGAAFGDPVVGPTPAAGWGRDCTQWIAYSDPYLSNEMCYDPLLGSGGDGWRDCVTHQPVEWPPLNIELWMEMECVFHWDATHVQVHRASDYSDVYIYLSGGSSCNNGQYIITTPPSAVGSLDNLPFVVDMFGRDKVASGATDIPLTWEASLNGSPYTPMVNQPDGSKYFLVPLSDNNWVVRIIGDIVYHQADGYYFLGGPGAFTCPAEPM